METEKKLEQTKQIYLRPMEISDTERIVNWRNKEWVRKNFIYQNPFTEEGHLQGIHTQVEPGHVVQFIICMKQDGRPIGSVYFRDIDREALSAEYGIFIGEKDTLGKGYGTQAANLAVSYALEKLKLNRIFLRVFEDNIAARKSYEKAGFVKIEGRQDTVMIDDIPRKVIFMERCR